MNVEQITTAIVERYGSRLRSRNVRSGACRIFAEHVRPLIPDGTLQWLVMPEEKGENARQYVLRAYYYAAARASWAGGLKNGATASDAAAAASVQKIIHTPRR